MGLFDWLKKSKEDAAETVVTMATVATMAMPVNAQEIEKTNLDFTKDAKIEVVEGARLSSLSTPVEGIKKLNDAQTQDLVTFLSQGVDATQLQEYLKEHNIDMHATNEKGENLLHLAAWSENASAFSYLASQDIDINAKTKTGKSVNDYVSEVEDIKDRNQMFTDLHTHKDYNIAYGKEFRSSLDVQEDVDVFSSGGLGAYYSLEDKYVHLNSFDKDARDIIKEKMGDTVKYDAECAYILGDPMAQTSLAGHEFNHLLHDKRDGAFVENLSLTEQLKLNCKTEELAHTSQVLHAALMYQQFKDAGVKTYVYIDKDNVEHKHNIDELLDCYSPKVTEYVKKHGFDYKNEKDVNAVAKLGTEEYWEKEYKSLYIEKQFKGFAEKRVNDEKVDLTPEEIYTMALSCHQESPEYKKTVENMAKNVVIMPGTDITVDLNKANINSMSNEEAFAIVLSANNVNVDASDVIMLAQQANKADENDFAKLNAYIETQKANADVESLGEQSVKIDSNAAYFGVLMSLYKEKGSEGVKDYFSYQKQENIEQLRQELKEQKGEEPKIPSEYMVGQVKLERALKNTTDSNENTQSDNVKTADVKVADVAVKAYAARKNYEMS